MAAVPNGNFIITCPIGLNLISNLLLRWLFGSTAVKVSPNTVNLLNDQYTQFAIDSLKDVAGSQSSLALQPITKAQLQAARNAGGDAIDLDPALGTFICKPSFFLKLQSSLSIP